MRKISSWTVLAGLLFALEVRGDNDSPEIFSQNAPLDLAPFGYAFRADAPAGANPPETQWLTNGQADVLAGVMWEEHRPVRRIEIQLAEAAPEPAQLRLEVTTSTPTEKQNNRPTWWTREYEVFPGTATRSADGRGMVYESTREAIVQRLNKYPEGFRYKADPKGLIFVDKVRLRYLGAGKRPPVVALRVFGISTLVPLRVQVEWGFQPGPQAVGRDGRLEVYNGRLGTLKPLSGSSGCVIAGPDTWRWETASEGRLGIEAEIFYVADDVQEVVFRPSIDLPTGSSGLLTYHPNRTVVTLRAAAGSFSFAPKDLGTGEPILVPSLGYLVSKAGSLQSATGSARQIAANQPKTIRQRVRQMPEQSLARALAEQYTANRPPYPHPECEPPMTIEVPDKLASAAWRVAFWHVQRRCLKEGQTYQIYIWPYKALLGQESWRIFYALDLLGEHAITRSGFEPWFRAQGTLVARGMFSDRNGALNVSGWDLNHAQGHGSMLYAMAQHYLLTGDKAWLTEHRANFEAACAWIERQRRQWTEKVGPHSWSAGLVPPCEMGDYADWRSLYQTSVFFWRGLKSAAEALREIEPETGDRFGQQAEDFRRAILQAADRSVTLTPVIRVSDGTYRRYIPPQPYLRGLCEQITNPFGGAHAGSLVMDGDLGAAALGLGVLRGDDARLDETLDVLEDVIYHDNWMVRKHARERLPNQIESWFTIGGYYYQCGYSQSALAHLFRDDVPNYLRSTFNQYAADVDPEKGYQFREHPNRTGEGNGGDKTFEVAAFLERMRAMFVMEDNDRLWLARATPRAWLAQGKRISVKNAPTRFGIVGYEIVSDVQKNTITATVELPARSAPQSLLLRLRHPQAAPLRSVEVNGEIWSNFEKDKEAVHLEGLKGLVRLRAHY
jgi:hypothetical protein